MDDLDLGLNFVVDTTKVAKPSKKSQNAQRQKPRSAKEKRLARKGNGGKRGGGRGSSSSSSPSPLSSAHGFLPRDLDVLLARAKIRADSIDAEDFEGAGGAVEAELLETQDGAETLESARQSFRKTDTRVRTKDGKGITGVAEIKSEDTAYSRTWGQRARAGPLVTREMFGDEKVDGFGDIGCSERVVRALEKTMGLAQPTKVQVSTMAAAMKGADLMVRAPTGSGKTLAFLLPIVEALAHAPFRVHRGMGCFAIVIAPTRELATQIYTTLENLLQAYHFIVPGIVAGGENARKEKNRIRKGINILVATPGRLLYHLENTQALGAGNLMYLVLDEADRLLDMGFKDTLSKIRKITKARARHPGVLAAITTEQGKAMRDAKKAATKALKARKAAGLESDEDEDSDAPMDDGGMSAMTMSRGRAKRRRQPMPLPDGTFPAEGEEGPIHHHDHEEGEEEEADLIPHRSVREGAAAKRASKGLGVNSGHMVKYAHVRGKRKITILSSATLTPEVRSMAHASLTNPILVGFDDADQVAAELSAASNPDAPASLADVAARAGLAQASDDSDSDSDSDSDEDGSSDSESSVVSESDTESEEEEDAMVAAERLDTAKDKASERATSVVDDIMALLEAKTMGYENEEALEFDPTANLGKVVDFMGDSEDEEGSAAKDPSSFDKEEVLGGDVEGIEVEAKVDKETLKVIQKLGKEVVAKTEMPKQLRQTYVLVPPKKRLVTLVSLLRSHMVPGEPFKAMVFMSSRDEVEFLTSLLDCVVPPENMVPQAWFKAQLESRKKNGVDKDTEMEFPALFDIPLYKLHGHMDQKLRTNTYFEFVKAEAGILFTTNVSARGLDIPAVSCIVQFDSPGDPRDYVHRVGRTARLGRKGAACLMLLPSEAGYVDVLQQSGIRLRLRSWEKSYNHLMAADVRGDSLYTGAILQRRFEDAVADSPALAALARGAYLSFVRAYATYPKALRAYFHVKKIHLGHIAKAFGLRESPTEIKSKHRAGDGKDAPRPTANRTRVPHALGGRGAGSGPARDAEGNIIDRSTLSKTGRRQLNQRQHQRSSLNLQSRVRGALTSFSEFSNGAALLGAVPRSKRTPKVDTNEGDGSKNRVSAADADFD